MNLDPLRNAAYEVADFLSRALPALLWTGQSPESTADLLISALAGMAAALAVALALTLYFRTSVPVLTFVSERGGHFLRTSEPKGH